MSEMSVASVLARLGDIAVADVPLAPLTTYRVGGRAAVLATPRTLDELRVVASVVRDSGLPVLVLGRGSNVLVADNGFDGIVVTLQAMTRESDSIALLEGTGEAGPGSLEGVAVISAGAAVALPVLARRSVAMGLAGFEWAVGVPGSVGGAVRMNAGGHGSDMAAVVREAWIVDLHRAVDAWVPAARLGLRFRGSDLADHQVVIAARLGLRRATEGHDGEAALAEIVRWRREHQPGGQNAGSVFVNPVPGAVAAAQLIDSLGLRGFAIGSAHVSEKHANFIQASDGGTAADVLAVMQHVRRAVHEATGVLLRSEVRLVGFDSVDHEAPSSGVEVTSVEEVAR